MSKSVRMSVLLASVLIGAWILSKSKLRPHKRVDVIEDVGQEKVSIPKGYHLMPDGSLMKDEDHNRLGQPSSQYEVGWFPSSPAQGW